MAAKADVIKLKGTKILVTVDEALVDVLVVTFHYGGSVFQGALLDVNKKDSPFGIPDERPWSCVGVLPEADVIALGGDPYRPPNAESTSSADRPDRFHALRQRQTYFQLPQQQQNGSDGSLDLTARPRKPSAKGRDRNVRMRRLRPRQVLCSHCRAICNENSENVQIGSIRKENNGNTPPASIRVEDLSAADITKITGNLGDDAKKQRWMTVRPQQQSSPRVALSPVHGSQNVEQPDPGNNLATKSPRAARNNSPNGYIKHGVSEYQAVATTDPSNRMILRKRGLPFVSHCGAEDCDNRKVQKLIRAEKVEVDVCDVGTDVCNVGTDVCNVGTDVCSVGTDVCNVGTDVCNVGPDVCCVSRPDTPPLLREGLHVTVSKTSPVIKISFANPQGKDTVVKIPARLQYPSPSDTDEDNRGKGNLGRQRPHKGWLTSTDTWSSQGAGAKAARKALKKAKKDAQKKPNIVSPVNSPTVSLPLTVRSDSANQENIRNSAVEEMHKHKHHHHKHKLKRKKKHKDSDPASPHESAPGQYRVKNALEGSRRKAGTADCCRNRSAAIRPTDRLYEEVKNMCLKRKLSISLKRLNAKAYMRCSPKYVIEDNSVVNGTKSPTSMSQKAPGLPHHPCKKSADSASSCSESGDVPDFPEEEEQDADKVKPLMMRIRSHSVKRCVLENGREMTVGDIVWGKIHGFPWWPGKVLALTVSRRDNGVTISQQAHVAWFGSSTSSLMPCSQLAPFLDHFKIRYNKKKRGPYKEAIRQATQEARQGMINQKQDQHHHHHHHHHHHKHQNYASDPQEHIPQEIGAVS